MKVISWNAGNSLSNNQFLIVSELNNEAICVDPLDDQQILEKLASENVKLSAIVVTHFHPDHTRGMKPLLKEFGEMPVLSAQSEERLEWEGLMVELFDVAGHTMDHRALRVRQGENVLAYFLGDTVFHFGVGNTRNGGDTEILYTTIERLKNSLQEDTPIYVGHHYAPTNRDFALSLGWDRIVGELPEVKTTWTTINTEKSFNPFFCVDRKSWQRQLQEQTGSKVSSPKEAFCLLRQLRDQW